MTDTTHDPDDHLLKSLRNSKGWPTLGNAAADRIEELEAKLKLADVLMQAAVAAALREAAKISDQWIGCEPITSGILALITPDAQAALDRVVAEHRERIKGLVIIDEAGTVTPEMWDIAAAIRKGGE